MIGDVVFTTPAIRALAPAISRRRITYLVEHAAAPVVAGNPHIDDGDRRCRHARPRRDCATTGASARRLRRGRFDLAIDFHGGPRALVADRG